MDTLRQALTNLVNAEKQEKLSLSRKSAIDTYAARAAIGQTYNLKPGADVDADMLAAIPEKTARSHIKSAVLSWPFAEQIKTAAAALPQDIASFTGNYIQQVITCTKEHARIFDVTEQAAFEKKAREQMAKKAAHEKGPPTAGTLTRIIARLKEAQAAGFTGDIGGAIALLEACKPPVAPVAKPTATAPAAPTPQPTAAAPIAQPTDLIAVLLQNQQAADQRMAALMEMMVSNMPKPRRAKA